MYGRGLGKVKGGGGGGGGGATKQSRMNPFLIEIHTGTICSVQTTAIDTIRLLQLVCGQHNDNEHATASFHSNSSRYQTLTARQSSHMNEIYSRACQFILNL